MEFNVTNVSILALSILIPWFFIFRLWKKNKKAQKNYGIREPEYPIDHEALNKAQKEADKMDLRLELMQNHQCIHKFYSLHGVSESYLYELIGRFREAGIHADFIFVQSMPTGYASYVGNTGTYEFFVESDKLDEARSLLAKILSE